MQLPTLAIDLKRDGRTWYGRRLYSIAFTNGANVYRPRRLTFGAAAEQISEAIKAALDMGRPYALTVEGLTAFEAAPAGTCSRCGELFPLLSPRPASGICTDCTKEGR
jgi:hypothetical protein